MNDESKTPSGGNHSSSIMRRSYLPILLVLGGCHAVLRWFQQFGRPQTVIIADVRQELEQAVLPQMECEADDAVNAQSGRLAPPGPGVDGCRNRRWHSSRSNAQRLWLSIFRTARWNDRFVGYPPMVSADATDMRRRMVAWAIHLAASRSRPLQS